MRKHMFRLIILVMIGFGVMLVMAGCAGEAGEKGDTGPPGPAGEQGPVGPAGPAGASFTTVGEGVQSEITDVTIGEDNIPVITFTLSDASGTPLSMDDVDSVRFLLSRIEVDEETSLSQYVNYFLNEAEGAEYNYNGETLQPVLATQTQPTYESGEGEFAELNAGEYTYTFAEPLGEDYNPDATHVLGAIVTRVPRQVVFNTTFAFVPSGGEVTTTRLISTTDTCNNCHNELSLHGGSRKQFEICVLCHTPQNVDPETGNSLDIKVMIHRIHSGEHLPSVEEGNPYYIVGFRQSVHDYSRVAWPQDTRNCETCHTGPDGDNYKTAPNNAACSACHDNVDATTALNHEGSPKTDAECIDCHTADMIEFDEESIPGSHVIPANSTQLAGVNLEIVTAEAAPGESPTVSFKVTNDAGDAIAPADMDYLAVTLAGPTGDYVNRVTETIYRKAEDAPEPNVEDLGDGVFSYTFEFAFPDDASGSYGFGLEGYVMETLEAVEDPIRVAGFNPVVYASLDGGEPVARRQVIDKANCNNCHNDLTMHGTIRQNTDYCVMCHNPMATDAERRPEEALPPTSINFRVLVHRIHRGAEADNPLVVYGFGGSAHDYSELEFPGNLAQCSTCHVEDSYALPLPSSVQSTTVLFEDEVLSELLPITSVCTSCHDSAPAMGHAEIQTASNDVETCVVCHAAGREISVLDVHD